MFPYVVTPVGIEPTIHSLKGSCFTTQLQGQYLVVPVGFEPYNTLFKRQVRYQLRHETIRFVLVSSALDDTNNYNCLCLYCLIIS